MADQADRIGRRMPERDQRPGRHEAGAVEPCAANDGDAPTVGAGGGVAAAPSAAATLIRPNACPDTGFKM